MSPVFLFSLLLIAIACSDGAATEKKRRADVTKWLEKINVKWHNKKLIARQGISSCLSQLDDSTPPYCNYTVLSTGLDLSAAPTSTLSDQELAALNDEYSKICIPDCIDPIEEYYNCLAYPNDFRNYLITALRHGVCGQESGDYCEVRYLRQYDGDYNSFDQLINTCTFASTSSSGSGIDCSGASSTCLNYVNTFSNRMGCCTQPYLGSGVTSCSGVSVDEPCTGVSSATGLVAPVFVMLFVFASYIA